MRHSRSLLHYCGESASYVASDMEVNGQPSINTGHQSPVSVCVGKHSWNALEERNGRALPYTVGILGCGKAWYFWWFYCFEVWSHNRKGDSRVTAHKTLACMAAFNSVLSTKTFRRSQRKDRGRSDNLSCRERKASQTEVMRPNLTDPFIQILCNQRQNNNCI